MWVRFGYSVTLLTLLRGMVVTVIHPLLVSSCVWGPTLSQVTNIVVCRSLGGGQHKVSGGSTSFKMDSLASMLASPEVS